MLTRILIPVFVCASLALAQLPAPLSQKALMDALSIGGTSQRELLQMVKQRGVEFRLSNEAEAMFLKKGASLELLQAIRTGYRQTLPAQPASTPSMSNSKPLSKAEIVTLLQAGTTADKILKVAKQRGIGFRITPDIAVELSNAGADSDLMNALNKYQPNHAPVATPSRKAVQRALVPEEKDKIDR